MAAGLMVALLPAVASARTWPVVTIAWGALAFAYGIDALLSPRRRGVTWACRTPRTLYIGETDHVFLNVGIPSARPVPVQIGMDLSDDLKPQPAASGTVTGTPVEFRWKLEPLRRGTVQVQKAWIRFRSPLGLWLWLVEAELSRELPVLPNLLLVRSTALRFFGEKHFRAGLKIERYKGDGTEFESLKEFALGDDSRGLDWKASARHRKLLCRQYRAERNHQILLTVDTGHLMSEPLDGIPKLDHALNAALVLAYICLRSGDRVGLFTFDAKVGPGMAPVSGVGSMTGLTQLTSSVEYSSDETNFTLGLTSLAQKLRRRSLIILLTDFVDTVTAELMLENIDRLGRRHVVVFVSLRDPLLTSAMEERPASLESLNRAVVAGTFLRDREVIHRRLQRMGIHPLDVEPGRIGPELINQYLDIKRRELV
jgi:uncharacterized protein (DUF58 family)